MPNGIELKALSEPLRGTPRTEAAVGAAALRVKRLVDVVGSATLLVATAPVMLAIACAVRLDSRGPALFRQVRIGRNRRRPGEIVPPEILNRRREDLFGKPFTIYKFRTMGVTSSPYATTPSGGGDPRVTRLGRFLRRSCLDELPQVINVLRGEMSLVGPRPEMPFIVRDYAPHVRRRLDVAPGITGLWQIHATRERAIHESIEWDLEYIDQWSLGLDMRVLLDTLLFVLRLKNF